MLMVNPEVVEARLDEKRLELIKDVLRPLVKKYLDGYIELSVFKTEIDSLNKRHQYWGFRGHKGQMFFNMTVNAADDKGEIDRELKVAIKVPGTEESAASQITNFASYVKRSRDKFSESGGASQSRPEVGSVPFFLSYFWQIQDPDIWPVYYTNSVNIMRQLNFWKPTEDLAVEYLTFKHIQEELTKLFSKQSGKSFGLYEVEHVFWFKKQGKEPDKVKARYWKVAPGENAWQWNDCREGNFIAMGWDELGDMSGVNREEFERRQNKLLSKNPDWTAERLEQVWKFSYILYGGQDYCK